MWAQAEKEKEMWPAWARVRCPGLDEVPFPPLDKVCTIGLTLCGDGRPGGALRWPRTRGKGVGVGWVGWVGGREGKGHGPGYGRHLRGK